MNLSFPDYTVAICGLLYIATAIGMLIQHKWGLSLAYFAYALANVGLIIASVELTK